MLGCTTSFAPKVQILENTEGYAFFILGKNTRFIRIEKHPLSILTILTKKP